MLQTGEVFEPDVPAAAVVGVVAGEDVEQRPHGEIDDVARAATKDFQARAIGAKARHAAAAMLHRAAIGADGFHVTEIADRGIKPAVDPETQTVGRVVGGTVRKTEGDILDENF